MAPASPRPADPPSTSPPSLGASVRAVGPGPPSVRALARRGGGGAIGPIPPRRRPGPRWSPRPGPVATDTSGAPTVWDALRDRPAGKESVRHDPRHSARRPDRHPAGRRRRRIRRESRAPRLPAPSWCGPCRQMRPAVERLAGMGYPDPADRHRPLARAQRAIQGPGRPDLHRRQRPGQGPGPGLGRDARRRSSPPSTTRPSSNTPPARASPPRPRTRPAEPRGPGPADEDRPTAPAPAGQPPAVGDRRPDQDAPLRLGVGLRLGDDHLQHGRGVDHPDLRPHLPGQGPVPADAQELPGADLGRPLRRPVRHPPAGDDRLLGEGHPRRGDRLRLHQRRRPDPDQAGPEARRRRGSSRPGGSPDEGHEDVHRGLLARPRRDRLGHDDPRPQGQR